MGQHVSLATRNEKIHPHVVSLITKLAGGDHWKAWSHAEMTSWFEVGDILGLAEEIASEVDRVLGETLRKDGELSVRLIKDVIMAYEAMRSKYPEYFTPLYTLDTPEVPQDATVVGRRFVGQLTSAILKLFEANPQQGIVDLKMRGELVEEERGPQRSMDCAGWTRLITEKLSEGIIFARQAEDCGLLPAPMQSKSNAAREEFPTCSTCNKKHRGVCWKLSEQNGGGKFRHHGSGGAGGEGRRYGGGGGGGSDVERKRAYDSRDYS